MLLCFYAFMKIAHLVSTYPPYYGGMGNTVFEMASGLVQRGHEVAVFTPDAYEHKELKPAAAEPEKAHTDSLDAQIDFARRLKPSFRYGNAARIPQVREELEGFDLVHLHYPFFGTANLVRKWKLAHPRKPLVITYHMDTRAPGWKGLLFRYYAHYWMPKILKIKCEFMNWLKENWFKLGMLLAIFTWLFLEVFQIRLNPNFFKKCDFGGRFGDICDKSLFVPKR